MQKLDEPLKCAFFSAFMHVKLELESRFCLQEFAA